MPPIDELDTPETDLIPPAPEDEAGTVAQAPVEAPANAASSTATDDSKTDESDALSLVRDVVEKRAEAPAAASSAKSEEAGPEPGGQTTKTGDDDYADVPFNKHPRFQQLLRDRNELKVDAVRYRNVQGFLDREGLSGEDAAQGLSLLAEVRNEGLTGPEMADGLRIMAMAKTNPVEAWKAIKPWVQNVLVAAGEVLPDDLVGRVNAGELTPAAAAEISRHRAVAQSHEVRQTFAERQAEARRFAEAQGALTSTVASWEADRRAKDPNFDAKLPAITAEVQRLHSIGLRPTSPEGIREQLQQVYRTVNGRLGAEATNAARAAAPAPRAAPRPAIRPVMGGQVAGNTGAEPQDTMDHVNAVLSRRRAG